MSANSNLEFCTAISDPAGAQSLPGRSEEIAHSVGYREAVEDLLTDLIEGDDPDYQYEPHLRAVHSKSVGYAQRVPGCLTGRVHHLLSRFELDTFQMFDWRRDVFRNIREQYALPLELTQGIAKQLGIRHPWNRFRQEDAIMTVDFLLTKHDGSWLAVDFKPETRLKRARVKWKFLIVRLALEEVGVPHVVMTESDIPATFVRNCRFLRILALPFDRAPLAPSDCDRVDGLLREATADGKTPIFAAAQKVATALGLDAARVTRTAFWLIANREWEVDFSAPIGPDYPVQFVA